MAIETAVFIRREEATRGLPPSLTRPEYEAVCARVGVSAVTDEQIRRDASLYEHARFGPGDSAGEEMVVHQPVGLRRLRAIEAERKAARAAARPVVEWVFCPRCDAEVRKSLLMASSTDGSVCADCYAEVG